MFGFCFSFLFRHLSFHQRCPSTSVSNSIESFCVPRSWTANFSRRSKRHRTHGERLLRSFHLINQIFLPKQKKKNKKIHISFYRLLVSQLWCSISWWLPFAGCWSRESTSTCLLWKFTTSTPRCTCITSSHGVFPWLILLQHVLEVVPCSHIWCCHQVKCFEFIFLYLWLGFPMIMMAIAFGIAAAKEGIQSYVSDK